jgi:hypothetical protein
VELGDRPLDGNALSSQGKDDERLAGDLNQTGSWWEWHDFFHRDHDYTSGRAQEVTAAYTSLRLWLTVRALSPPWNPAQLFRHSSDLLFRRHRGMNVWSKERPENKCRSKQNIYAFALQLHWAPCLETGAFVGLAAGASIECTTSSC